MSKKTIILTAVILIIVLAGAGIGYKTLTARRNKTSAQETGQTVPYSPESEKAGTGEKTQESVSDDNNTEPEINNTVPDDGSASNIESTPDNDDTSADSESIALDENTDPGAEDVSNVTESELPPAPDFTVYTSDGTAVKLSDFRGKPVIVNFWASWCPPCKAELPDFNDLYKEYGDQIEFMMVNLTDGSQETPAVVSAFLLQTGYTFPVYLDTEGSAAYAYGIYSIPVTVGVDKDGQIIAQRIGSMSGEEIREILDQLLN